MQRREFLKLLGGTSAAWPTVARAQRPERVRRLAVLNGTAPTGQSPAANAAFLRRLADLGWNDGRNVRIEERCCKDETAKEETNENHIDHYGSGRCRAHRNIRSLRWLSGRTDICAARWRRHGLRRSREELRRMYQEQPQKWLAE
jgi:hypothetical protein